MPAAPIRPLACAPPALDAPEGRFPKHCFVHIVEPAPERAKEEAPNAR